MGWSAPSTSDSKVFYRVAWLLGRGKMVEIDAILITDVNGIGTTADDQLAFVSLIADQGETTTVAFGPEIGSRIAASFMAACGQLQHQIATRTGKEERKFKPFAAAGFSVRAGLAADGSNSGMLSISTVAGAEVHFIATERSLRELENQLTLLLEQLRLRSRPN
ncbi:hypothetical protein CO661_31780 [Sinorhizobium fredii]|uniref:Uncharacterized protein n=2 Tax=Rhizobium fredii TaxID=380 RepID=A0A2A6LNQ3_RHIFR|nr:hypothetical protein CO661_31780 [Sinorhizobium fredii]